MKKQTANQQFFYLIKWLLVCICIGAAAGTASAIFLVSLDWVTHYRENQQWIIVFLPLAGLLIGLLYHYRGSALEKGNHLLLEEIHEPQKILPFIMAPFIYLSTLITHLFGGSAGREGTAIQMGGSIADQFAHLFRFEKEDRKLILIVGIAAGFAAVFGTPWAGIVFGWEVVHIGRIRNKAILPAVLASFLADVTCKQWGVVHTPYAISFVPEITWTHILLSIFAGCCFGCASRLFIWLSHQLTTVFKKKYHLPTVASFDWRTTPGNHLHEFGNHPIHGVGNTNHSGFVS